MRRTWFLVAAVAWIVGGGQPCEAAEPITLKLTARPEAVSPGGALVVTAVARSGSAGAPLAGVEIRLRTSGGHFGLTAREARGVTDEQGVFRAVWRTGSAEGYVRDTSYVILGSATRNGYTRGRASLPVNVRVAEPPPVPAVQDFVLQVKAEPPRVPAGGSTVVSVTAKTRKGVPVAGATVDIAAGGGSFVGSNARSRAMVSGTTDAAGTYRVTWRTAARRMYETDTTYQILTEVSKRGFRPAHAQQEVRVLARVGASPPLPRLMSVQVSARPPSVAAGGSTTILVQALTSAGEPLADAQVRVAVGGGFFARSRKTEISGRTGRDGTFHATWKTSMRVRYRSDMRYAFDVDVHMSGYRSGHGSVTVTVRASPPPAPAGMRVSARVEAASIPATGSTGIVVHATGADGGALPGARVSIAAGGGVFDGARGPSIVGRTGPDGSYRAVWRPGDPRAYRAKLTYSVSIRVAKDGYRDGATQVEVTVVPAAPARPRLEAHAQVHPSALDAGGAGTVLVHVRDGRGAAVRGARVTIVADGGFFRGVAGRTARGVTDAAGRFQIQWRTNDKPLYVRDTKHVFKVTVEGAGGARPETTATVLVRAFRVR